MAPERSPAAEVWSLLASDRASYGGSAMAIGIPAYHQQELVIPYALQPAALWQTMQALGWNPTGTPDGLRFQGSSSPSWGSFGERLTVTRVAADRLSIRSECVMPTQVLDFGKNEKNVLHFIASLQALAQGLPLPPRP